MIKLKKIIKRLILVSLFFLSVTLFGTVIIIGDTIEHYYRSIDTSEEIEVVLYPEHAELNTASDSRGSSDFYFSIGQQTIDTTELAKLEELDYINGYNLDFEVNPATQSIDLIGGANAKLSINGVSDIKYSDLKDIQTVEELNEGEVIVSTDLAIYNDLEVGDVVTAESVYGETMDLTVVGFYPTFDESSVNDVYTSIGTAHFFSAHEDNIVNSITIYVDDVEEFMALRHDVKKSSSLKSSEYNLAINNPMYINVVAPLEAAQGEITKLLLYVLAVTFLIGGVVVFRGSDAKTLILKADKSHIYKLIGLVFLTIVLSLILSTYLINDIVTSELYSLHTLLNDLSIAINQEIYMRYEIVSFITISAFTTFIFYTLRSIRFKNNLNSQEKITKNI